MFPVRFHQKETPRSIEQGVLIFLNCAKLSKRVPWA